MFSISNKHEEFFDYLIENAENFHRGTLIAKDVMTNTANISMYMKDIAQLEHTSDKINEDVIMKLCRVFITPAKTFTSSHASSKTASTSFTAPLCASACTTSKR